MVKAIICGELSCQTLEVFARLTANRIARIRIIRQFLGVSDGLYHGIVDVEFPIVSLIIKESQHFFHAPVDLFERQLGILEVIVEEENYFRL